MSSEELDLEDIEARLYSQVYHAPAENEEAPTMPSNTTLSAYPTRSKFNRYFRRSTPSLHTYISLGDENRSSPKENRNKMSSQENTFTTVTNNISFSPNLTGITTEGNFPNQFQNNITVNQYTLPPDYIINSDLDEVLNPPFGSKFYMLPSKNQKLLDKKNRKRKKRLEKRREKNQEKNKLISSPVTRSVTSKLQNKVKKFLVQLDTAKNARRKDNDIIYISDDSDDACVLVQETQAEPRKINTGFPKKYDESVGGKKPESDNEDIIYIPPPPIEVINIDVEENDVAEKEILTVPEIITTADLGTTNITSTNIDSATEIPATEAHDTTKDNRELVETPESTASNDFLDSSNIETNAGKFNFGLHGSDFRNTHVDFLRPTNRVDFCETESSCSTNEPNRDFNNTVKTIVFNEYEFPKDDIFSENNLERFGTLITPKRKLNNACPSSSHKSAEKGSYKNILNNDTCTSTDSSSESDYETLETVKKNLSHAIDPNKKLPNLSPMLSENDSVISKRNTQKIKCAAEFFKNHSTSVVERPKRESKKRKSYCSEESDSESDIDVVTVSPGRKKTKRKKKVNVIDTVNKIATISTTVMKEVTSAAKDAVSNKNISQKVSKQNIPDSVENIKKKNSNTEDTCDNNSGTLHKKKRKKNSEGECAQADLVLTKKKNKLDLEEINAVKSSEKPKKKKKKNVSLGSEEVCESVEKSAKKKKKTSNISLDQHLNELSEVQRISDRKINIEVEKVVKKKKKLKDVTSNDVETPSRKKKKNSLSEDQQFVDKTKPVDILAEIFDASIEAAQSPLKKNTNYASFDQLQDHVGGETGSVDKDVTLYQPQEESVGDTEIMGRKVIVVDNVENSIKENQNTLEENVENSDVTMKKDISGDYGENSLKKKKKHSSVLFEHPPTEAAEIGDISSDRRIPNLIPQLTGTDSELVTLEPEESDRQNEGTFENEDNNSSLDMSLRTIDQTFGDEINGNSSIAESNTTAEPIAADGNKDSDIEDIIVVDIEDCSNISDLLVVDEIASTDVEIEVVDSSGSEFDFREFGDVGQDLKLANCTTTLDSVTNASEPIVVDDSSGSNSSTFNLNRFSVDQKYLNFDIDRIHSTQSDNPESWKISYKDRITHLNTGQRGPRCNRCRHFGHMALKCPEKPGPPSCTLCGNPDHQEPRCPNKMCTQCGNQGDYSTTYCWRCFKFRHSICLMCRMKGHIAKYCPDLWRRYHLTTEEGAIVVPQEPVLKPRDQQWCSGCANRGHLEHECDYYHREYPPTNPSIVSYEDVLYRSNTNGLYQEIITSPLSPLQAPEISPLPNSSFCPPTPFYLQNFSPAPNMTNPTISAPNNAISPLMSLEVPEPVSTFPCSSMVVPSLSQNCLVEMPRYFEKPKPVLNPFSLFQKNSFGKAPSSNVNVFKQMELAFSNNDPAGGNTMPQKNIFDTDRIKHIIMSMPCSVIKEFLSNEMADLEQVSNGSPKYLKKKLFECDRVSNTKHSITTKMIRMCAFWYRIINMFIFGVHKFRDGNMHIQYLRKFLSDSKFNKLDVHKRKSLFLSYSYIFGTNKHINVNYYKIITMLIQRYGDGK